MMPSIEMLLWGYTIAIGSLILLPKIGQIPIYQRIYGAVFLILFLTSITKLVFTKIT